jgi:hypothetical protein
LSSAGGGDGEGEDVAGSAGRAEKAGQRWDKVCIKGWRKGRPRAPTVRPKDACLLVRGVAEGGGNAGREFRAREERPWGNVQKGMGCVKNESSRKGSLDIPSVANVWACLFIALRKGDRAARGGWAKLAQGQGSLS